MFRSSRGRGEDPRDHEYRMLDREQRRHVDAVIAIARRDGQMTRKPVGDIDYYAYPHPGGGVAWGMDGGPRGCNLKRGVKP